MKFAKAPNKADFLTCFKYSNLELTFICVEGVEVENDVSIVINCYDVELPSPDCCKFNIIEFYCV